MCDLKTKVAILEGDLKQKQKSMQAMGKALCGTPIHISHSLHSQTCICFHSKLQSKESGNHRRMGLTSCALVMVPTGVTISVGQECLLYSIPTSGRPEPRAVIWASDL